MNMPLSPNRLPEPPPVPAHDFRLDLLDGERLVGWIAPDAIAFTGFGSDEEAAHAAWMGFRALSRLRTLRDGSRAIPIDSEPLRLVATAEGRIVMAAGMRVARLLEPAANPADGVGFEIRLDTPLDELSVRAKAHHIYRTLRRSGIRWSMWLTPPREPAPVEAPASTPATVKSPDDGMVIEEPLAPRHLAVSVLLLVLAVVGVIVPGAIAVMLVLAGIGGLVVLRLTALHRGWPPRRLPRVEGYVTPSRTRRYGGYNAAPHA